MALAYPVDKGPELITPARPLRVLGVEPADRELSALETIIPAGKSVYVLRADPRQSGKSPAHNGWLGRSENGKIMELVREGASWKR